MYTKILLASSMALVLFTGCNTKQYYTPKNPISTNTNALGDRLIHYSRDGATLASGKVLTRNQSVKLKIEKGFYFINSSSRAALTADAQGNCNIVTTEGTAANIKFDKALVAGTMIGKHLVYLLQDNSFGVYDFEQKKIVYNNSAEKAYAIDTRIANPLQIDTLAVIPTLDGKLTILDLKTFKISKEVYVSTEATLNNIIFLNRINNSLIAATPYKVLSLSNKGKKELETAISDVILYKKNLFVFAKDGRILKVDEKLSVISEKKFKFAHFSVAAVFNDKVFALDKQGFLIVSNTSFSKHKVYKIEEVEGYAFVSEGKLYYDNEIMDLNTLNYE